MTTTSSQPASLTATDIEPSQLEVEQLQTELSRVADRDRSTQTSKRSIWSSIRLKATLLAVAIGIVPVVAIGGVAYYFANQSISQQITAAQKEKATVLSEKVNRFMADRYSDIQNIANLSIIKDPKLQALATTAGQQEALDKLAEIYEVYDSIAVYGLNGKLIVNSTNGLPTPDIASSGVFKSVLVNQIPYISSPEQSEITGNKVITIVAPVKERGSNKLIAVALARLPITFIDDVTKTFAGAGNDYYITDASGRIFISSKTDILGKELVTSFSNLDKLIEKGQPDSLVTVRQSDYTQQLLGYTPVPKFGNLPLLNWSASQSVPTDIAFKSQRDLLRTLEIGTGIAAILVGLLAVLLASRFTRPILQASTAVEKLGQGELDTRIPILGSDELAVLGSNINQMAGQIQSLLGNLKESAAEIEQQKEVVVQESQVLQTDVGHILDVVLAVEDGDLTVQAEVSDRATGLVSDTLNRLIEELAQTLGQVLLTARQVTKGAKNLEDMSSIVANNSSAQSHSIADVLNLTEDVEKIAKESSENVSKANQALLVARTAVEKGQISIESLNEGFEVLQRGMDAISKRTEELQEFINLADRFAQEQSQVASMTQMLSLSADQLGAKALAQQDPQEFRKSGLEFKAIANQIGELSKQAFAGLSGLKQQSAEVHALISGVNKDVRDLAQLVASFDAIVTESNQAFSNVQGTTEQVIQVGNTVEQSSQKIVEASQSTAQAMRNIAQLAERTAQLTQTTQAQSESMGNLSEQLLGRVQFFRLPEEAIEQA
jgi:twitching motility protein PilJ